MLKIGIIFVLELERPNSGNPFAVLHWILLLQTTAQLSDISIRPFNTIYFKVRQRIAQYCELEPPLQGAVEVDGSYLGAQRVRGKRGRDAYGKTIFLVF